MNNNIVSDIDLILNNIPTNITDLEKVRWLYIKLGLLFSYDYRIMENIKYAYREVDFNNIGRYETCIQISQILDVVLRIVNGNIKTSVVNRVINTRGYQANNHVANAISFTDEVTGIHYDLLLDLTLDLFRIQSDLQTKQFAFTTDDHSNYDIISLNECEEMDTHLKLMSKDSYNDQKILEIKSKLDAMDISLEDKIFYMWLLLGKKFNGSHEAKLYLTELFNLVFPMVNFKEYNLSYKNIHNLELNTLFIIETGSEPLYILLDNHMGLIKSNPQNIKMMLDSGWKTNSKSLDKIITPSINLH
jgi:hypothetical protein